jgi:hypothetical protein
MSKRNVSFKETLSEWSGPIMALVAVAALGVTGGYYTANSENAALTRDLSLRAGMYRDLVGREAGIFRYCKARFQDSKSGCKSKERNND